MTVIYLIGGPRNGTSMTTTDRHPKDLWRFEFDHVIHTYITMKVKDPSDNLWWIARHDGLSQDEAIHIFQEEHYVPSRRRRPRR